MIENYLTLVPLFPLLSFLLNSILIPQKLNHVRAGLITFMGLFASFICVIMLFLHVKDNGPVVVNLWEWLSYKSLKFNFAFMVDELSIILSLMVTGIGSAIAFFSIGYMDHEEKVGKFFALFALFAFSMLLLVHGENFLVLFMGWEGVGLSSYLLIGFWYEHTKNGNAAKKAFLANRVGDFGLILGMIGFAIAFNTISFMDLKTPDMAMLSQNKELLILSGLFLVLGAAGKSAQIPLFIWLPDAMMGPTPVSALMHAATMVTAGIFLLCRVSNVLTHLPIVLDTVAWVGALTALLAALIAITQRDIKKILAYSTVSQLGFMILACGVGAFSTGMFHVFTHAFFKALLFLGAASVIYACHHEQDIFKMGGLKKKMPVTFWTFFIGYLAICGVPGFSGFFSKDEILWLTLNHQGNGIILYSIALVTALLTAFYMTRMLLLVFIVPENKDHSHHHDKHEHHDIHENSSIMTIPLSILALFSFGAGFVGLPHLLSHDNNRVFQKFVERFVMKTNEHGIYSSDVEITMMSITIFLVFCSMGLAYYIYAKNDHVKMRDQLQKKFMTLWSMSSQKFKVDEFYETVIIHPLYKLGHFLVDIVETHVINGIVKMLTKGTQESGEYLNETRPAKLDIGILYIIVGMTILITAIFNAFMFK